VINQSLLLAIHELSHNLAFERPLYNRLFSLFVNLPVGVPVAAAFRYYHLLHHAHQGAERLDADIPTALEARVFRGRLGKFLWLLLQGFFYAGRPLALLPKKPSRWEIANFIVQAGFNVAIFYFFGLKALLYLPIGSLIVMGLHPIAGHYISEHYVLHHSGDGEPQETYSYYGPLNLLAFNVGYHNEHHDFPYIAGSRLPALRRLAPEFYDTLSHHSSWTRVLWDFWRLPDVGGYNRVKRRDGA
jgi:sphingolipid delta-4 desaturase